MKRCLIVLGIFAIVIPHLIPLPESVGQGQKDQHIGLATVPDDGKELPKTTAEMEKLASNDPIKFLENCVRRYERDKVTGYHLILEKQERLDNNLEKKEVLDVWFKEQPHSVFLEWREGARKADRVLYVEGENQSDGKSMIVAKPHGLAGRFVKSMTIDPESKMARSAGRYPLPEFGMKKGLLRTLESWRTATTLHVEYEGIRKVKELGDRDCFVLHRTNFKEPEGPDRVTEQMLYVDVEHWLLVGTILHHRDKNNADHLVARYLFRDIQLNPRFADDQFTKKRIEEK